MNQDQQTYQRATNAALIGLAIQVLLTVWMALMGLYTQAPAIQAATWHLVWGIPIWLFLVIIYHQHSQERAEALETEQLAAQDAQSATIFGGAADDLAIARRRLDRLYKWGLNGISLFVAACLIGFGLWMLSGNYQINEAGQLAIQPYGPRTQPMVFMFMCAALAFVGFVVARYVSGMTRITEWQLLRGGASYMMGNVVVAIILFAGMLCAQLNLPIVLSYSSLAIPAIMAAVGVEILITALLSAYRPRKPGEMPRPAFDSRVLGLLTSPESIAKIINETINYQFGFEVSRSWFYQLLGKAFTPLVAMGLLVLILMSCMVVVEPNEQAVITHNGRIAQIVGPGLHAKWPWPFGRVKVYTATQIHSIRVGSETDPFSYLEPMLWDAHHEHSNTDYLLTAAPGGDDSTSQNSEAMLIGSQILVEYRISDLQKYTSVAYDPKEYLTALAERQVNAYFMSHNIDQLISQGRTTGSRQLLSLIRSDVEKHDLGIEVLFVTMRALHPPKEDEVAGAFHKQIGALQERQSKLEQAQQQATRTLAEVAGTPESARQIDQLINEYRMLSEQIERLSRDINKQPDSPQLESLIAQRESMELKIIDGIKNSPGNALQEIYKAQAARWTQVNGERTKAQRFAAEMRAFEQAPIYYKASRVLDALAEGMAEARKTIIAVEGADTSTYRLDLKEAESILDFSVQE